MTVRHMPIGMLVVLDSILNRITQNQAKGKNTFIFIDEIYLLFQHEYSANFLFTLWKAADSLPVEQQAPGQKVGSLPYKE